MHAFWWWPAVRRYVCRVLDAEGYAVHEAVGGAEALEEVRRCLPAQPERGASRAST